MQGEAMVVEAMFTVRFPVDGRQARELLELGALLIDVRPSTLSTAAPWPGALAISVSDLADRLLDLPEGKTLVVACEDGRRSRFATELLSAAGFDAVELGRIDQLVESGRLVA